jgi:serine/threonine-protein kinase
VVDAVRHTRPAELGKLAPSAPAELVSICERAMARVPSERYRSVRDLRSDLHAYLDGRVVRAHASGALAGAAQMGRSENRTAAVVMMSALIAIIASLVGGYWIQLKSRREAEQSFSALEKEQARSEERLAKSRWATYRTDLQEVQARIEASDVTPRSTGS